MSVYDDMFRLISAVKNRERITLDSRYFSRKLLGYLYDNDVFEANEYNNFDDRRDYNFMLDMFNKRDKSAMKRNFLRLKTKCNGMTTKQNTIRIGAC